MSSSHTKTNILSALFWKLMERGGTQGIQFFITIILARILSPEEYGIIAIVMVFIQLANIFVESGFNTALIQKKNIDEVDFSSVLYLSLFISSVLYAVIFFVSPFIANFYGQAIFTPVLRILSLTLFIGAFNSIQNAFVARNMQFKKLFQSSLCAVSISGIVGIIAAYNGLGVWTLVIQQLTSQFITALILWFTVKWRPRLLFSFTRVKILFSYGSKLLASGIIDTIYRNFTTLLIGRIFTPSMLGYFNRGDQFPQLIISNINGSIQSVMLPALSSHQDDKKRVKEIMRRAIVSSSFLVFPMMVGMAVISEPLIKIVLTDKWLPAVPFLQIACFTYSLWPIHTANLQAINAMGRSDIFLKLEIIKKVISTVILVVSIPFGIYAIAIGSALSGIIGTFINVYPNKSLLNYSYKEQSFDLLPSLVISLIMGGVIYTIKFLNIPVLLILILQIMSGIALYFGLAKIFKIESYTYLAKTLKETLTSKKKATVS